MTRIPSTAEVVQKIADTHFAIATSEDLVIAGANGDIYKNSQRLLLAAIRDVYGLSRLKAWRVYDVWIDCYESVAYCVGYVTENRESSAYQH